MGEDFGAGLEEEVVFGGVHEAGVVVGGPVGFGIDLPVSAFDFRAVDEDVVTGPAKTRLAGLEIQLFITALEPGLLATALWREARVFQLADGAIAATHLDPDERTNAGSLESPKP